MTPPTTLEQIASPESLSPIANKNMTDTENVVFIPALAAGRHVVQQITIGLCDDCVWIGTERCSVCNAGLEKPNRVRLWTRKVARYGGRARFDGTRVEPSISRPTLARNRPLPPGTGSCDNLSR
jgi:hypothetical protein